MMLLIGLMMFYRSNFESMSKYNVGLKTLLQEGLFESEFYGDLVYKFRKIVGKTDFFFFVQFKKTVTRYEGVGYNMDIPR